MTKPQLPTCVLVALTCLFGLSITGCSQSDPRTISLLHQSSGDRSAVSTKWLLAEKRTIAWLTSSSGLGLLHKGTVMRVADHRGKGKHDLKDLTRKGGELVQIEEVSSIRMPTDIELKGPVLVQLEYEKSWDDEGDLEVRFLRKGVAEASKRVRLHGKTIKLKIEIPLLGADTLDIRHHIPQGSLIPLRSTLAVALGDETSPREFKRAWEFLRWASATNEPFMGDGFDFNEGPVSRGRLTIECISLVGGDTLSLKVPPGASEQPFSFWFTGMMIPREKSATLELDEKTRVGWKMLETWSIWPPHIRSWTQTRRPPGYFSTDCSAIRFTVSGSDVLVGIGEPVLLPSREERDRSCNLILIDFDTMRADRLGTYGYKTRPTSARLDSVLKDHGFFLFRHAYSASPWTLPATAKFLTSRYMDFHLQGLVPREYETLPEILRENGYYCAGFTGGGQLLIRGFEQGFHEYYGSKNLGKIEDSFPQAEAWLKRWAGGPFFLFIHTYETHGPFIRDTFCQGLPHGRLGNLSKKKSLFPHGFDMCTKLSTEESLYVQAAYDGGIRVATDALADLFVCIGELDLWKNSLIIILSDHGEEFWDHLDAYSRHCHSLYGELLNVPFIVYNPHEAGNGLRTIEQAVTTVDLLPTVVDLLDLPWKGPTDGISLRPLMDGEHVDRNTPILASMRDPGFPRICVISDSVKYIEPVGQYVAESHARKSCRYYPRMKELYRICDDPMEQRDLISTESELTKEMQERLQLGIAAAQKPTEIGQEWRGGALSEDLEKQLRALGYVAGN